MSLILDEIDRLNALLAAKQARIVALEEALKPFANYAEKRDAMPLKGLGDSVSQIHRGSEWEAEITLDDCRRALAVSA